jgi:hypothetical protein
MSRTQGRAFALLAALLFVALPAEAAQFRWGKGIVIRGGAEFVFRTRAALDRLKSMPTGAEILRQMELTGRSTVITSFSEDNATAAPTDFAGSQTPGVGSDAEIQFNPSWDPVEDSPSLILGHELIHAMHINQGKLDLTPRPAGDPEEGIREEELKTVGLPPHQGLKLTDGNLRREWNFRHPKDLMGLQTSYLYSTFSNVPAPASENRQIGPRAGPGTSGVTQGVQGSGRPGAAAGSNQYKKGMVQVLGEQSSEASNGR